MFETKPHSNFSTVAGLTILALLLRLYHLNAPLWYDEIATLVQSLRVPLVDIVSSFPSDNDHPLYSLLAKISILVFGESNWAFRLPAALFGAASVPALYWLGCKYAPRHEALAASLLLAVMYHSVWFSQNARGYTIMLFLTLVGVGMLQNALNEHRLTAQRMGVYVLCIALAAYTHMTMVLVAVSHAIVLLGYYLFSKSSNKKAADLALPVFGFLLAALVTLAMYYPMSADVLEFFVEDDSAGVSAGNAATSATPRIWAAIAAANELSRAYGGWIPVAVAGVVFLVGIFSYVHQTPWFTAMFVLSIPIFVLVTTILERPTRPRFFFFMAGFLLLVAVRGVAIISNTLLEKFDRPQASRPLFWVLILAISAGSLGAIWQVSDIPKQDYQFAEQTIDELRNGAPVFLISKTSELPFNRYLGNEWDKIETDLDFLAIQTNNDEFVLVYTFQRYVEFGRRAIWALILKSCIEKKAIPATVADGEIHVLICRGNPDE